MGSLPVEQPPATKRNEVAPAGLVSAYAIVPFRPIATSGKDGEVALCAYSASDCPQRISSEGKRAGLVRLSCRVVVASLAIFRPVVRKVNRGVSSTRFGKAGGVADVARRPGAMRRGRF